MPKLFVEVAYGVGAVAGAVTGLYSCWKLAASYLTYRSTHTKIEKVKAKLAELGIVTPEAIDDFIKHLVEKGIEVPAGPNAPGRHLACSSEAGNRIAAALRGLMDGSPAPTGRAVPRSAAALGLPFLQDVLKTLNPLRKSGEAVAPDDEGWVLERLLGTDSFGEVWLGTRKPQNDTWTTHNPQLRTFRFFTKEGVRQNILTTLRDLNGTLTALGKNPHIVNFHHLAVYDTQYPYIASEYVPGGSLDQWILEKPEQRAPLRKHEIIGGIISALAKAHESGIHHRALNPRKILLTERFEPEERNKKPRVYDVQAKVADFGLADITAEAESQLGQNDGRSAAKAGLPPGKIAAQYLPPEADRQQERSPAQDDVFALGVIWYQLLIEQLERPPYDFAEQLRDQGHDAETIRRISGCLAHPDRRYKDARHLADDVDLSDIPENLPEWPPTPKGFYDVSHLVRDFIAAQFSQ